jgi:hypothetical protein
MTMAGEHTVLDSTKILVVTDEASLPVDVRSGEASMTRNVYLKSLIKDLVCRLDCFIVRKECEADASESTLMLASALTERT